MKFIISVLVVLFVCPVFAGQGNCVAKQGAEAHENFCNDLTQQTCGVHANLCTWEKANAKTLKIIDGDTVKTVTVIEETQHHCTAQPGKEVHESFCAAHNKQICAVHSALCQWE